MKKRIEVNLASLALGFELREMKTKKMVSLD